MPENKKKPQIKTHDYDKLASQYAELGIDDTNYLAFRDIPQLIQKHAKGMDALDYGCGAGRSTRFLKNLGLDVVGVDISHDMLEQARSRDSSTRYYNLQSEQLPFEDESFDIVFSSFVFLEISTKKEIEKIFSEMMRVLRKDGVIIVITSSMDVYKGNWVGFKYDFPENNRDIQSGETFKLQFQGTEIILYDYLWTDEDYKQILDRLGLRMVEHHKPLGYDTDPVEWLDEKKASPVAVYIIKKA
jgi:ubiquinone/menaquinone biosynthesis C-methylase UbiE